MNSPAHYEYTCTSTYKSKAMFLLKECKKLKKSRGTVYERTRGCCLFNVIVNELERESIWTQICVPFLLCLWVLHACASKYSNLTACLFGRKRENERLGFWLNDRSLNSMIFYHAEKPLIRFIIYTTLVLRGCLCLISLLSVVDGFMIRTVRVVLTNSGICNCLVDYVLTKIRIVEEDELLPAVLGHHLHDDLIKIDRWADH